MNDEELRDRFEQIAVDLTLLKEISTTHSRLLEKLVESQIQTDESLEKLAQAQFRTEEKLEKLADAQTRTDEKLQQLTEAQVRAEERQTRADERIERVEASVQKLSETVDRYLNARSTATAAVSFQIHPQKRTALSKSLRAFLSQPWLFQSKLSTDCLADLFQRAA
jgi:uncharacterized phage infection (PIP) family protein YhgE